MVCLGLEPGETDESTELWRLKKKKKQAGNGHFLCGDEHRIGQTVKYVWNVAMHVVDNFGRVFIITTWANTSL